MGNWWRSEDRATFQTVSPRTKSGAAAAPCVRPANGDVGELKEGLDDADAPRLETVTAEEAASARELNDELSRRMTDVERGGLKLLTREEFWNDDD